MVQTENEVNTLRLIAVSALVSMSAAPVMAANVDVQMLNKGEAGTMVFEPALVRIAPGDTVTFLPTDKGHNAESIKEMIPEGGEVFKGSLGKEVVASFTVPGVYGIKCAPHLGMGMVAIVVVGDDVSNLEAAKAVKVPKKALERLAPLWAEIEAP
jgi:pseudoazurin